jgi:hypothetical protein
LSWFAGFGFEKLSVETVGKLVSWNECASEKNVYINEGRVSDPETQDAANEEDDREDED